MEKLLFLGTKLNPNLVENFDEHLKKTFWKLNEETVTNALAFVAVQLARAHVHFFPFNLTSEPCQVGMAAWFVSVFVHCWHRRIDEH